MDINAFKVFQMVATEGSVTKAAERLNYVQSNVTARIKQLEKELGMPLFYRHNKKLTLTPTGHQLLPYANKLLQDFNEAMEVVLHSSVPRGPLSIGTIDATAAVRLPRIIAKYYKQYPEVELNLLTTSTEQLVKAILEYKLEGAFVDGPIEHPEIISTLAFTEQLVFVTPPTQDPFHLEHFLNEPLFTVSLQCVYVERWQQWLRDEGYQPAKVIEFGEIDGILGCVENELGVTILPKSIIDLRVQQGLLNYYPVPEPYGLVPTLFIRRRDSYCTNALHHFVKLLNIAID